MTERITEADLRRWETDEAYESRAMARPPIIVLVAEVRRLRKIIGDMGDGIVMARPLTRDEAEAITHAICAEARAIREEQGT